MMRALWTSASGMATQQFAMDVLSNNLANVNTTGFKKSRAEFQDLLYEQLRHAGSVDSLGQQLPLGLEVGHGARPVATQKIFSTGTVTVTNNPLDLMVNGDGFFQVTMPDGSLRLTRDGSFQSDAQGRVVTADGHPLEPAHHHPQRGHRRDRGHRRHGADHPAQRPGQPDHRADPAGQA